jgi:hypothetical protein
MASARCRCVVRGRGSSACAIYKVVPDVDLGWQDVWIGAVVTAVLFVGGKAAIGFYLDAAALVPLMAQPDRC